MPIVESGITLDFPDNNFFRFQDCQGYTNIQNNFKEMDACWYDESNDILYIIELKDWKNGILSEQSDPNNTPESITKLQKNISNNRIDVLFKKSIDSLSMFLSILLKKPYSSNIQNCAPFKITNNTKIKLLSIIIGLILTLHTFRLFTLPTKPTLNHTQHSLEYTLMW